MFRILYTVQSVKPAERCGPLARSTPRCYADFSCVSAGTVFDRIVPHRSISMGRADFVVPFENIGEAVKIVKADDGSILDVVRQVAPSGP